MAVALAAVVRSGAGARSDLVLPVSLQTAWDDLVGLWPELDAVVKAIHLHCGDACVIAGSDPALPIVLSSITAGIQAVEGSGARSTYLQLGLFMNEVLRGISHYLAPVRVCAGGKSWHICDQISLDLWIDGLDDAERRSVLLEHSIVSRQLKGRVAFDLFSRFVPHNLRLSCWPHVHEAMGKPLSDA
jgi:hypothetical protein